MENERKALLLRRCEKTSIDNEIIYRHDTGFNDKLTPDIDNDPSCSCYLSVGYKFTPAEEEEEARVSIF